MQKRVLMIANFSSGLDEGVNSRVTYLANLLSNKADVTLVASDFSHLYKKHRDRNIKGFNFTIKMLHEIGYSKNVGLKRFISHFFWGIKVNNYLKSLTTKPDVIYATVPSLTGAFFASRFCVKNDVRFVIDIQDLWPEAFEMIVKIPVFTKLAFAPFKLIANKIYESADCICAVSNTYCKRATKVNSSVSESKTIFLGNDLDEFDENVKKNSDKIQKKQGEFWIGYCGTLGSSYDLKCAMDALEILSISKKCKPTFVIMGDGPKMKEFVDYQKNLHISCRFLGYINYEEMCGVLKKCDVAINPIMKGAAQSIINKHGDYAAAGIPVVSNQENAEYRELVEEYNMGINCKNSDAHAMAEALYFLINNEELRIEMGKTARKCAEEKFNRKTTYRELVEAILL